MPKILEELYECTVCNKDFGNQKSHYERHLDTLKHKRMMKPKLAKQLADIKMEQMELKSEIKYLAIEKSTEVKRLQIEKDLELRQKELEIKEQIKEQIKPERVVTLREMEMSQGIDKFMDRVALRATIDDYMSLYYGYVTFQDIFKRDFSAEYEEDKVYVIDKDQKNIYYYINNAPCHWFVQYDEKEYAKLYIFSLITHYYNVLKENAIMNGCKVKDFNLEEIDKKELEEWMKEEITFSFSYKS